VFSPDGSSLFFLSDHATKGKPQIWSVSLQTPAAAHQVSRYPVGLKDLGLVPWGDDCESLVCVLVFSAMVDKTLCCSDAPEDVLSATAELDARRESEQARGIVVVDDLPVRHWDTWDTKAQHAHPFIVGVARPEAPTSATGAAHTTDTKRHRWRCGKCVDLLRGKATDCPDQPWGSLRDSVSFFPGAEAAVLCYRPEEWRRAFAWSTGTAVFQCSHIPILDLVSSARDAAELSASHSHEPVRFRLSGGDAAASAKLPTDEVPLAGTTESRELVCSTLHECLTGGAAVTCSDPAVSPNGSVVAWIQMRRPGYESDRREVVATNTALSGLVKTVPAPSSLIPVREMRSGVVAAETDMVTALSQAEKAWCLTSDMDVSFKSLEWSDDDTLVACTPVHGRSRVALLRVDQVFLGSHGGSTPNLHKLIDKISARGCLVDHGEHSMSSVAVRQSSASVTSHLHLLAVHSAFHLPPEIVSFQVTLADVDASAVATMSVALSPVDSIQTLPAGGVSVPLVPLHHSLRQVTRLTRHRIDCLDAPLQSGVSLVFPCGKRLDPPDVMGGVESSKTARDDTVAASAGKSSRCEGDAIHEWVVFPPGVDPSTAAPASLPLVCLVHGGPQGDWSDAFEQRWNVQLWAAQGFVCVMPNFTGSKGFGQAFTDAIQGDWGGWPAADVIHGVEAVYKHFPCVDRTRAVVAGASYGGYMVNWLQAQAPRGMFCAAVSHAGLFDMRSFYFSTEEIWFPEHDFGGHALENPEAYEAFNPCRFASLWRTPMLITAGGQDFRVPQEQALSAFTALRRQGVAARLMVLPEASHWVTNGVQYVRWVREMLAWAIKWTTAL
jgi:pimeloyl-ACP methyl ester carboxylesterase